MIVDSVIEHMSGTEDWGYIDIDVYVLLDTGEEWLYRISKSLETGVVLDIDPPRYAATVDDDFDDPDPDKDVPQEVLDFVTYNMAEILVLIGRAQAEFELKEAA